MLDPPQGDRLPIIRPSGDPVAGLTALLIGLVAVGLFVAGILAVYDYNVPAVEGPVVLILLVIFGVALVVNLAAAMVRSLRRLAP
jgi:hypothetical protein